MVGNIVIFLPAFYGLPVNRIENRIKDLRKILYAEMVALTTSLPSLPHSPSCYTLRSA